MEIICPVCGAKLIRENRSAVCAGRHSFDYARQGYLNLLIRQSTDHGDNREMVQARTRFLNSGAYAFLKDELVRISEEYRPGILADLGCGEGYYTCGLAADEKYGFDMSKDAVRHASASDKSTQYIIASIFHLPMPDQCADMALTCFAPFAGSEVMRILRPGGIFVFVSPAPKHLAELKQVLYDRPYDNAAVPLNTGLTKEKEYVTEHVFHADQTMIQNLFMMTPYAHRTSENDIRKLSSVQSLDITASFLIRIFRKPLEDAAGLPRRRDRNQ